MSRRAGSLPPGFDYARTHNVYALARFVRAFLGLAGPAFAVSTACAATSKVFATAARMISAGLCDAAIVGGADTLCATTLFGFHALGLMAEEPVPAVRCRPARHFHRRGRGFRAAGTRRPPAWCGDACICWASAKVPTRITCRRPIRRGSARGGRWRRRWTRRGLEPAAIDYINLHGTATQVGDAAEDCAVSGLFGGTPCSSTKGFTGHTLGASGVVEAIFSALAIQHGFLPGSPHTSILDPGFKSRYVLEGVPARIDRVMSNSFGFGGVNCSLVLGRGA